MRGVVRLALRANTNGVVNVYALRDGSKWGEIGLKTDRPIKIIFAGEETAEVMGKNGLSDLL